MRKNVMHLKIIKSLIFIVILYGLWTMVFDTLWLKTIIIDFFKEPKNTMDVIYIGPSSVYYHFNATLAYHKYGFTTGILSTGAQPPSAMEYLIREAKKNQNPKLYILDLNKFIDNLSSLSEGDLRTTLDSIPFSLNRIKSINNSLKYYDLKPMEYINYYFSFFKYHNSWKKISKQNFTQLEDVFKGFWLNSINTQTKSQKIPVWNYEIESIYEDNLEILNSLLDYLDKERLNCIFVIPEKVYELTQMKKMNYILELIRKRNYQVINFNENNDFHLDENNDFFDSSHLNIYGSTKYTLYFAKYLKEHYDLPNHIGDKKYTSWDNSYDKLNKRYKDLTKSNFEDLVQEDMELLSISN